MSPRPLSRTFDSRENPPQTEPEGRKQSREVSEPSKLRPSDAYSHGVGNPLSDSPWTTAPSSPQITPRYNPLPGTATPAGTAIASKTRATTLDIPGLTRSKVSPDGRIASRDVGSKLVIVMVGLPARGKSYMTKKLARYLNWLQHDTKIFNVGEKRRVMAAMEEVPEEEERPSTGDNADASHQAKQQDQTDKDSHEKARTEEKKDNTAPTTSPGDVAAKRQSNIDELKPALEKFTFGDNQEYPSRDRIQSGGPNLQNQRRPSTRVLINGQEIDTMFKDRERDESPMTDFPTPNRTGTATSPRGHSVSNSPRPSSLSPLSRPRVRSPTKYESGKGIVSQMLSPGTQVQDWETAVEDGEEEEQENARDATPKASINRRSSRKSMDQSAQFFDPNNDEAVKVREQAALDTLNELLDYILERGGSVGILDATNSTLRRRKAIMDHIRDSAGPELNVIFLESRCEDAELLESNMRLKLSGPDYRGKDPIASLEDFRRRIAMYERSYVALGKYEEENNMPYVQTIDVSRKVVANQVNGFLSSQVVYYLLNFNLSPRQIWICRHGESEDDLVGKVGGDSHISENGDRFARALTRFIGEQRRAWEAYQIYKRSSTHFPPLPGDTTPPNPSNRGSRGEQEARNFCVWSSMLRRTIETCQYFDDEEYDVKQMRMLDEINFGKFEGYTQEEIKEKFPEELEAKKRSHLHYRYPGLGGESYLDIINRLRPVIVEVERMTDHVLLVGHRAIARVLLAYFRGLGREQLASLDVPLGVLYVIEPRPYGVEFRAYQYNPETDYFDWIPDLELRTTSSI